MDIKKRLKEQLSKELGLNEVVLFGSCRNALHTLLLSVELQNDDEVIIQDFICDSLNQGIEKSGARRITVPADKETFNLSLDTVKKYTTEKTKAIIFVHTYGNPSGVEEISAYCKENNIILIEDIAHALYASVNGKLAGTFGDYAIYSLTKQLVSFGGGAVLSNKDLSSLKAIRDKLHKKAPKLGYFKRLMASLYETQGFFLSKILIDIARKNADLKLTNALDKQYKITKIEAWAALKSLKHLKKSLHLKKRNYEILKSKAQTQKMTKGAEGSYNYLSLIFENKEKRDEACKKDDLLLPPWPGSRISEYTAFVPNKSFFTEERLLELAQLTKESKEELISKDNKKGVILALLCTAIVSAAQIFLKLGSAAFEISLNQIFNYPLIIGGILYVSGAYVLIKAFKHGELSVVYPVMASSYVIVTLLSMYFLSEMMYLQKWIGLIIITLGVIIIGREGNGKH